jgi:hypothetical protein
MSDNKQQVKIKSKQQFKSRFCIQDYDYDDMDWDAYKESIDIKYEDFPKLSFEEAYEINYKPKGFLLDANGREIYIDLHCEYELVAEDEIKLFGEWYYILDRQFNFDEKLIVYRVLRWDSDYYNSEHMKRSDQLVNRIENSITHLLQSIFKNVTNGKD